MAIDQIGSHKPTTLDSSANQRSEVKNSRTSYDPTNSSLISCSQAQTEGVGDFVYGIGSGLWSFITWPFSALGSVYSWVTGSSSTDEVKKKDDEDKSGKGGGGGGGSKGSISETGRRDFVEFWQEIKEDPVSYDSKEFKKVYEKLDSSGKSCFDALVWRESGYKASAGSQNWAKAEIKKDAHSAEVQGFMADAAVKYKAMPDLKKAGDLYAKNAERDLKAVDDEEADTSTAADIERARKAFDKLPENVRKQVAAIEPFFAPHEQFAVKVKKDRDNAEKWEDRKNALATKGVAYVMNTFMKNNFAFVSDAAARADLQAMVQEIGDKINVRKEPLYGLTGFDFRTAYKNMTSAIAKKAYADVVGYAIGRPKDGESYLNGLLRVDGKESPLIAPEVGLLAVSLAVICSNDGLDVQAGKFGVFMPRRREEEGGEGDDDQIDNPNLNDNRDNIDNRERRPEHNLEGGGEAEFQDEQQAEQPQQRHLHQQHQPVINQLQQEQQQQQEQQRLQAEQQRLQQQQQQQAEQPEQPEQINQEEELEEEEEEEEQLGLMAQLQQAQQALQNQEQQPQQ